MLLSEIEIVAQETWIDLPNTDAVAVLTNKSELLAFQAKYGNVEVVMNKDFSNMKRVWYNVPSFAQKREEYSKEKAKDCKIWGTE